MAQIRFPVIDPVATGANITRLRQERGLTVHDLQRFFGFDAPQAIYKWQKGQSLPSIDNLYALSALFQVSMNEILVSSSHIISFEQQDFPCCSNHFLARLLWTRQESENTSTILADALCLRTLQEKIPAAQGIRPFARRRHVTLHVGGNQPRSEDGDVWLGVRLLVLAR